MWLCAWITVKDMRNKILSILLLGIFLLNGCGSNDEQKNAGRETSSKGYVFETNDMTIAVDMDMSTIAEKLGDTENYFEEPSCAAQGTAQIYTYSSFEITTYPDGDKDLIASIVLKDDNVSTVEGVDLSMTKEDIISAYGSDYKEKGKSLEYEKDGMTLCLIMDGSNISSIEYDSSALN